MTARRPISQAELTASMKTIEQAATRFLAGKTKTRATWARFTAELSARADFVNLVRSTPPPPSCKDFVASPDFAAAAARDRTARASRANNLASKPTHRTPVQP
jgi:hypothetical protein